jgi:hypothetical protein
MQRRKFLELTASASATTIALSACTPKPRKLKAKPQNILFLGNSFTSFNQMPHLLQELARTASQTVEYQQVTPGGWTLYQHANNPESTNEIAAKTWNYVVLQEQSTNPSIPAMRERVMFAGIRALNVRIEIPARPLLFLTWGRENGFPDAGYTNYLSMQQAISSAYQTIAAELDLPIAPVGEAWKIIVEQHPQIRLWSNDGSHPNLAGSFLAACIFYAAIYRKPPKGIPYYAGLTKQDAEILQEVAGKTVLNNLTTWRL